MDILLLIDVFGVFARFAMSCLLLRPCCLRLGGGWQGLRGLAPCSTSDRRTAGGTSVPRSWRSTFHGRLKHLQHLQHLHLDMVTKVGPFTAKEKRQGALFGCYLVMKELKEVEFPSSS